MQFLNFAKNVYTSFLKYGIVSWIIALAIWKLVSLFYNQDLFPAPEQTFLGALELFKDGSLLKYIAVSTERIAMGWLLGSILGTPLGLLMGRIKIIKLLFEPFINFFRFIPALAFVTLFMLWFGIGEQSKVALITYTTLFIVTLNTMIGVLRIDEDKMRAARSLGASEAQIFLNVIIPASVPYIFSGIRLAMGNSFAAIVGAEMLAAQEGVGYLIWTSRLYFKTEWIFVGLFTLGLMGFLADKLVTTLGYLSLKRYGIERQTSLHRSFNKGGY